MKINSFITRSLFLIFVSIFTSSDAVKETVSHGSTNNHASLILELIKRLGQPSYNYQSADEQEEELGSPGNNKQQSESASNDLQSPSVCDHVVEKGSIIKTTESINAGAFYIDSVKYVKSNADCMGYCCQNSTCDVAVYQDKGDRYCYLFSCAGRCIFKSHTGYFVGTIKSRKSAEHPEEDLQNLNDEVTGNDSGNKKPDQDAVEKLPENQKVVAPVAELTTVKMVATTQNETPELVIAPHSVGLSGFCTLDGQCEDLNAVCSHENCVCKDTFYNKDGLCRKICIQSEFECFELGTLVRGPECVSKSRVCDLYLNCADGSDEFNCEKTAPNYHQTNGSQPSGPASSSVKGVSKSDNLADPYTQPVVQEPAAHSHQKKIVPQPSIPQTSYQTHVDKEHQIGSQEKADSMPSLQNYDVRLKPTMTSKGGTMHLNQNLYSGNVQPHPPQPNPYPDTGYVGNPPDNSDFNSAHASNTNQARKGMVNHEPYNHPSVPKNMNPASVQQADVAKLGSKAISDNPVEFSAPKQSGQHQRLDPNDNGQSLHKHINLQPALQAGYADAGQNNQYSSQFMDSHAMKNQQLPQAPQTNNQESGMRSSSSLHPETSRNSFPQNSQHADKLLPQKASSSSSLKFSKPTNSHSQNSGNASNKSRTKIQASSKSHGSPYDQSESQNRLSLPNYSNSQKWLDPNLYVPYNLGESPSQREQASTGNHYFDSSQYYPPYSSDALDPLPESLLENTGPNDDFSQFGGPDVGHGKSMGLPYNAQNSGYQGYPESSYGGQYPPSIRYDDSGDYRSPVYQDPDLYSSLGTQRAYRPSAGLYEDFPSGMRPPKSSTMHKVLDSEPPSTEQKNIKEAVNINGQSTQAATTKSHASKLPLEDGSSKNKTGTTTSPRPATYKPFPENRGEKKHIFLSSEKVIIANTSDAEGPIIALSLGLAFTLILLVLVGCRLRNVRHRLRKGRPLHQNEADYLINGMYL